MSKLVDNLREIRRQKIAYITPGNIKSGVTIYGVTGNLGEGSSSGSESIPLDSIINRSNLPYMLPGFIIDISEKDPAIISEITRDDFQYSNAIFTIPKPSDDANEWNFNIDEGYIYIPSKNTLYIANAFNFILWPDPSTNTFKITCIYGGDIIKITIPSNLSSTPFYKWKENDEGNVESLSFNIGDVVDEIEAEDNKFYISTSCNIYNYKESGEMDPETGNPICTYDASSSQSTLLNLSTNSWHSLQYTSYINQNGYIEIGDAWIQILNLDSSNTTPGRCIIPVGDNDSVTMNGYYTKSFTDDDFLLSNIYWFLTNSIQDGISNNISLCTLFVITGVLFDDGNNNIQDYSGLFEIAYLSYGVFKLQSLNNPDIFFYIHPKEENPEEGTYSLFFFSEEDNFKGFKQIGEGGSNIDTSELLNLTDEILHQHPSTGITHEIQESPSR